jgi:ribonuclease HI
MTKKIDHAAVTGYLTSASPAELAHLREQIEQELAGRKAPTDGIKKVVTFTDGASRGNPGHAGIGVILFNEAGDKILQDFRYIGQTTNNEAEYRALLLALDRAYEVTHDTIECYLDSELVVRQITGRYQVKSEKMARFLAEVRERVARFRKASFHNVPREHPQLQLADKLANRGIDEAKK